tara:strand:+ start:1032 stop:1595 length:564 start_codon:yes stop_codon:yes gene_type:complete
VFLKAHVAITMPTKKHKRDREEKKKKKKPTANVMDGDDGDDDDEEEEEWTKERVAELKRTHAEKVRELERENADLKRKIYIAEQAQNLVKEYPKHARLIEWLGGPEKSFPNPIAKAVTRLLFAKHHNDDAECLVQNTLDLLRGSKSSYWRCPTYSLDEWMDALEKGEDIDRAIDLFISMMGVLLKKP